MIRMREWEVVEALYEPAEAPQGFGLRQSSGAFDVPATGSKAPEDWRSPRRWRDNGSANWFMVPMRGQKTVEATHEPRGRARHSVRADTLATDRRARSDAPYLLHAVQGFKAQSLPSSNSLPTPASRGEEEKKRSLEIFVEKARTFAIGVKVLVAALAFGSATALLFAKEIPAPEPFIPMREFIQQGIRAGRAPSVAVAVLQEDRVIWAEGFGYADLAAKRPATADSVYLIASVSKPLATTGLMLLVDRGQIGLDKPANDYLPGARLKAYQGRAEEMTVRRLLNHTAGLPVHANFFYDAVAPPSRDETIRRYGFAYNPPGSHWEYSNLAFGVVDYIAAVVAGMPWGKFMERKLYDPLGMSHTSDHVRRGLEKLATVQYRYDVAGRFVRVPPYRFDHDGASTIWSSANDLARFLRLHLNDGALDGKRYFQPGTLRAMQTFSVARAPENPDKGYGLGFFVEPYLGHRTFGHTGGMPGVATRIRAFPDDRAGYVVLINASAYGPTNATEFREEISRRIAQALLPGAKEAQADLKPAPAAENKRAEFVGRWKGTLTHFEGDIPLALEVEPGGAVKVKFADQPAVALEKVSFKEHRLVGQMEGVLKTQPGYHGTVTLEFRLQPAGDQLTGVCVAEAEGYFALSHWVRLVRN